jgi:hypothetical protein
MRQLSTTYCSTPAPTRAHHPALLSNCPGSWTLTFLDEGKGDAFVPGSTVRTGEAAGHCTRARWRPLADPQR